MPYTKEQIRAFLEHNSGIWPLNFLHAVYGRLGEELLDAWLDSHDEDVVEARLREVAEGMADDNGEEAAPAEGMRKERGESVRVVDEAASATDRHRWDRDGERCVKCRDKDWMGGPCNTSDDEHITNLTAERDAAIREREELRNKLNRCPECNGEGKHDSGGTDASGEWINLPCEGCSSTGTIHGYIEATDKLRARVAELETAPAASGAAVGTCNTFCGERECERTDPMQCKRGEPQPARGGLTTEEREASTEAMKCMTKLRRERDAAIRERDAALSAAGITHGVFPELYELRAERERLRGRVAELERAYSAECDARAQAHRELSDLAAAVRERESGEECDHSYAAQCREAAAARDRADRMMPAPAANAGGEHEPVAWAELLGRLDHMTTAADGPYWIGEIKKVLSGAAAPLEAAVTPKSVSLSNAEGLRTERVTLEVTHDINSRPVELATWVRSVVVGKINPGESVRVVEEPAEIALITAERDLARAVQAGLRSQRDAARARVAELEAAAGTAGGDDAVVVPQTVVAGNFAQIHWNTCCRLHRMAMDKAGVRWTQSTEPSRPENEEAGNAGGEQEPPRGWLTEEERAQVQRARDELLSGTAGYDNEFANEKRRRAGVLTALLARETPPKVRKVNCIFAEETRDWRAWKLAETKWIAAIRAAGGEVADE